MVWKELGYCLVLARLAPRVPIGRSWEGRQMGLHIINYFTTASSHQPNLGSGYVLVWMYNGPFLALEKVFPHTKEFTA